MFVVFDAGPRAQKNKARMVAASARRKDFPLNADHFVGSDVRGIVDNPVYARSLDFITGPVNFRFVER